jgi:type IV pilus assembly protein PilB
MDIEPFLIADSVVLVVAQRLVRRLCSECRTRHNLTPEALMDIGFSKEESAKVKVYKPAGCNTCHNTGYKGRIGLFEVMEVTDDIKDLILSRAQSKEIKKKSTENGMTTLRKSGLKKIQEGTTSVEEVLRETVKDSEV